MEHNGHIPENLKNAGKELPFTVPDNYFEDFPGRLRDRLSREHPVASSGRLVSLARPYLSVAAIIAGIVLITWFAYHQVNVSNRNVSLDNYELSDIVDYYLNDYDEDILISTLTENGDVNGMAPLENYSDEIMDYLNADGIDYSLLINDN
jgi:hypothetical protein